MSELTYSKQKAFLDENDVTDVDMNKMWKYMYGKNFIVKNLTDHGQSWRNLNTSAQKSLIELYNEDCEVCDERTNDVSKIE